VALLDEHIDGKYEILGKLREGGMGAIYKVRHRLLDEVRVVKVIRSHADAGAAERFLSEAKAAIKLRHPNVAVLHDFAVTADGQAFIVMEYIDGWNLLDVLNGYGPPPIALTLEIACQSLKALGHLHRQRIVHRDVSPDNLMLTRDAGGYPLIKLIDLGIAKALEGDGGLTTTGVFLGKPRYGSPERFSGGTWDARSDLYSFGIVLYELLTGQNPIVGTDATSLMAGHLFRPPLDFAETDLEGRVPPELRAVVLKALAKKPEERHASAEDFVWELTMLQDRFTLSREQLEDFWQVLRPLPAGTGSIPSASLPGSTQVRLDLEFGMGKTPPAGVTTGPTATPSQGPGAKVVPFPVAGARESEATRRVTSVAEDLDATWATRPLRKPVGRVPGPVSEDPPAPRPAIPFRGAAIAGSSRRNWAWIVVVAVAVLALAAGGLWWWHQQPSPTKSRTAPVNPSAQAPVPKAPPAPVPTVVVEASPAPPSQAAVPSTPPAAQKVTEPPRSRKRAPLPEEPAQAPGPLAPMKLGDLIRPGQPGVEPAEIQDLPSYSYPPAAKGSGLKVDIRVAVLVDETGKVIDAQLRNPDNSGLGFNDVALETARKARFFSAIRDSVAGKMWTELLFEFAE
jgi:eukaryotic-like serine/threonine-protein kinase